MKSPYDVLIDRRTKWGNPFQIGIMGRDEVIAKHREWLLDTPEGQALLAQIGELRGKVLGCWCAPRRCHGDLLAELANR